VREENCKKTCLIQKSSQYTLTFTLQIRSVRFRSRSDRCQWDLDEIWANNLPVFSFSRERGDFDLQQQAGRQVGSRNGNFERLTNVKWFVSANTQERLTQR
jgi:hypothetical protein